MSTESSRPDSSSESRAKEAAAASQSGILRSLFRQRGSFGSVDDAALAKLAVRMSPRHFYDGETICEEGDPGEWTFVVAAGEVVVAKKAADGAMVQVNILRPGNWGGMMSVFGNMPRSAQLLARGEVELRTIDHEDLIELLAVAPDVAVGLLGCMGRRLREDATHLASTLHHVSQTGLENIYQHCSPQERLMLDTIRHRAAAAESLGEIMDFVFDSIHHIGNCNRLTLLFLEDDNSRAVSHWTKATYHPLTLRADYREDLAGSPLEDVYHTGQARVINDMEHYARTHPDRIVPQRLAQEGIRSSISLPLVAADRTVGFLVIRSQTKNAYDEHHVLVYQAVVRSISQAVEKAYRIEQLTQANHDYEEVLSFVSHELQSPIAAMVTDAKLLADGYLGELNEKQIAKLRRAIDKGQYLLTLVRDFLDLSRLEDPSLRARIVSGVDLVSQVIEPAIANSDTERTAKNIVLERDLADPLPPVDCDATLMRVAFGNLLINAVKYGHDGGSIQVGAAKKGRFVRLTVWNSGPGFDDRQRTKLFQKFSRLDDPALRKEKGTGIGLYSTWRIMQLHRGRVTARSEQGAWAEFVLSFPINCRRDMMEEE